MQSDSRCSMLSDSLYRVQTHNVPRVVHLHMAVYMMWEVRWISVAVVVNNCLAVECSYYVVSQAERTPASVFDVRYVMLHPVRQFVQHGVRQLVCCGTQRPYDRACPGHSCCQSMRHTFRQLVHHGVRQEMSCGMQSLCTLSGRAHSYKYI